MESLLFSLNATVPVFLMMVLGAAVRRLGLLDVETARKLNRFVFRLALPVLLFNDMSGTDISQVWDGRFVLFCVGANAVSIAVAWVLALPWKDKSIRGEFVQASYRSSAALLGTAILTNLYGSVGMAPLMMAITVPAYNIVAVVALNVFRPDGKTGEKGRLGKTLRGIVTNPLIIGILLGLVWSALKVPMPAILGKTLSSLGSLATPLGLMAMGATFDLKSALSQSKPAAAASFMKLAGFCILLLPVAVAMGFRGQALVVILVMLGSATSVSSYVMVVSMGHAGALTSGVVMLTTLLSGFTFTGWLWLLRAMGLV